MPWNQYMPREWDGANPKQELFLSCNAPDVFMGGAAGGGKSYSLVLSALQYFHIKGYSALLLRRTFPQLEQSRGIIPLLREMLAGTGATYRGQEHRFYSKEGATITCSYIANDADLMNHQGGAHHFIGFDEGTQFTEYQLRYMFSRLRKDTESTIPLRLRVTSNPGGPGHEFVKARYILKHGVKDRITIRASLSDNPFIDKESYLRSMSELDPTTRAQLLNGDWDARRGGGFFKREWFSIVDELPAGLRMVRYWDLAATEKREDNDPDYTAGALMGSHKGKYYIADIRRVRESPGDVEALIRHTAEADGKAVPIWIEREGGASGKSLISYYQRQMAGWTLRGDDKPKVKDVKITRASPLASQAEAGNVCVVRAQWNPALFDEMESFPDVAHDDQIDAISGAFSKLTQTGGVLAWMKEQAERLDGENRKEITDAHG